MLQTHTWYDCLFSGVSVWKRSTCPKIESRSTKESAIASLFCTQCNVVSDFFLIVTQKKTCHSQPSAWVTTQLQWLCIQRRDTQIQASARGGVTEQAVRCDLWMTSQGPPRSESFATSRGLDYTLGSLKGTRDCDITWKLLHLFSGKCLIFQSGLCSPIKITDIFLPVAFTHSNTDFWEENYEGASMGLFSREAKNAWLQLSELCPKNHLAFPHSCIFL